MSNAVPRNAEDGPGPLAAIQPAKRAIQAIVARGGPEIVFQPIVELATGATRAVEALSRFGTEPRRTPDQWFADAATIGLGAELELVAIEAALRHLDDLDPRWIMAVNVSPATIFTREFRDLTSRIDLHRVSFEITEHQPIDDYDALARNTAALRAHGARLAVDDAGAGYASFRHILKLDPDVIKLDISLTRGVDSDPVKRALAASLVRFAKDIGAEITAEGIETQSELDVLHELGICYGQGRYIAQPASLTALRGRLRGEAANRDAEARVTAPPGDAFLAPVVETLERWIAEGTLTSDDLDRFNRGELLLWELTLRRHERAVERFELSRGIESR